MKNITSLLIILSAVVANAQSGLTWSTPVDISTNIYSNIRPRIVADASGNPMIIWGKFTTSEVYFSKWNDTVFTSPVALNPPTIPVFNASWAGPDIASHGDTVYVVFKQIPEDSNHVYIVHSFDAGMSFSTPIQVDHLTDSISRFPLVSTDSSGNPVVAYMKFEPGIINPTYVVCRSNDYGMIFTDDQLASMYVGEFVDECSQGSLICSGNTSALLYRNNFNDFRTIWCGLSSDNSYTFPYGMSVDNTSWMTNPCPSSGPDGIIIGDSIYSVFMSGTNGTSMSYFSSSSMSTFSANPSIQLIDSVSTITDQNYPRISNSGNKVGIVCRQSNNGTGEVAFYYTDDITTGLSHTYDILFTGTVINADIVMTPTAVHVVWQDDNSETVKYTKAVFPTTTIQNINTKQNDVVIYPMPVKDYFSVQLKNNPCKISSVEVYDASGRKIQTTYSPTTKGVTCNLLNAKSGIYIVEIKDLNENSFYQKLIVNK